MNAAVQTLEAERAAPLDVEACYRQHRDRVFHLCLRYGGGDVAWAEDATQEVFVRVLRAADRVEVADLGGWLYRVTANVAVSRLRSDRSLWRRIALAWTGEPTAPPASELLAGNREAAAALDHLRALPPRERVILTMRLLDGTSQRQIAELLGLSEGYVSKLMKRAVNRLRRARCEVDDVD